MLLGAAVRNVEEARYLGLVCMALERGAVAPERGLQQLGQCGRVVQRMVGRRRRGFGEGTFVIAGVVTALEGCSVFTASSGDAEDAANGGDDVEWVDEWMGAGTAPYVDGVALACAALLAWG